MGILRVAPMMISEDQNGSESSTLLGKIDEAICSGTRLPIMHASLLLQSYENFHTGGTAGLKVTAHAAVVGSGIRRCDITVSADLRL